MKQTSIFFMERNSNNQALQKMVAVAEIIQRVVKNASYIRAGPGAKFVFYIKN